MKRIGMTFLLLLLCFSLLWGCGRVDSDQPDGGAESTEDQTTSQTDPPAADFSFAFSYQVEKTQYISGEVIKITAMVKNISGVTYSYTGSSSAFIPAISLYTYGEDGKRTYQLEVEPIGMTCDYMPHYIAHGESGSIYYYFSIPEDAVCGLYDLRLSYEGDQQTFSSVYGFVIHYPLIRIFNRKRNCRK